MDSGVAAEDGPLESREAYGVMTGKKNGIQFKDWHNFAGSS